MSDILTRDLVAYDPLTETTRKERKVLLGIAALGIAIVKVPLVPTKFSTLGIEFASINQANILTLYALLVAYFLVAFLIYGFSDYVAWRRSQAIHYREYIRQDALTRKTLGAEEDQDARKRFTEEGCPYSGLASYRSATLAAAVRASFEFLVPIAVATYSVFVLLNYAPKP